MSSSQTVRLSVFSTKPYDKKYLDAAISSSKDQFTIAPTYHDFSLNETTVSLVEPCDFISVFVNDSVPAAVIARLAELGIKGILLRCAGYNNVDLDAAKKHDIKVANVPSYSPEAVAEFAVALVQTLNRRTHRAYNRVREGNFALEGLLGQTLFGKTVGLIGTGKIGVAMGRIMKGFGCKVIAYDPFPMKAFEEIGGYVELDELLANSDVISLHCPLVPGTKHIISEESLKKTKPGVLLVNTSRGGLIDTPSLIAALKTKHLGGVALDVYEGEGSLFYDDHSGDIIQDDILMRLMTFPNAIVTGHQAFFTQEALKEIAEGTVRNLAGLAGLASSEGVNELTAKIERRESKPVRTV